ncbi:MAG: DUF302 domain-containing protein [Haloarculaceae archaeon]
MTLPIDPDAIGSNDIGEEEASLAMEHEAAVDRVREAFAEAGFGFPVEFVASELLNEKVDAGRAPITMLGACNPAIADRALDTSDMKISGLFPCGVIVYEAEPGRQEVYHLSIMRIARLVGIAPDNEEWADIVAETGEMVEDAFEPLRD